VSIVDSPSVAVASDPAPIEFEHLDLRDGRLVDYQWAWDYQREIHAKVAAEEIPGRVLLLEHAAVYTAGRQTTPEERPFDGTPVIDVDRGGKITWHGPGQLVGYPIIKLPSRLGVVDHVRRMESAIVALLAELGIKSGRVAGRTGVWLPPSAPSPVTGSAESLWDADPRSGRSAPAAEATTTSAPTSPLPSVPAALANVLAVPARPERKISAIGIRVAKRTTMHGFAINVNGSTAAFENIIPCGISDAGVTSIAGELGSAPSLAEVARMIEPHLRHSLDYSRPTAEVLAAH
jgi:lipoyl(octanoyl) transferase